MVLIRSDNLVWVEKTARPAPLSNPTRIGRQKRENGAVQQSSLSGPGGPELAGSLQVYFLCG